MELMTREKFKKTEIGLIPEDWIVSIIGDAFDICNNLRLPLSESARKKIQGIYPYYGPTKIQDYINEYRVDGEYALIGEDGDHFLKWSILPMTQLANGKFNVNNHAHVIKGKCNRTTTQWFYYFFKHRDITNFLTRQGAGRYKLTKATLRELPCGFPPSTEEQAAVTTALNDTDALITALENLIAKKRNIKQGAMQELLRPQVGWMVKRIGEMAEVSTGNTPPTNDRTNYGDDYFFVSPADLGKGKWILSTEKKLSTKGFGIARRFPQNSILFTCIGSTIGKSGMADRVLTSNQQINAIFPNDNYNSEYLFYALNILSNKIKSSASEQAVPLINKTEFSEVEIPLPPTIEEQMKIANILSDMDADIDVLERKLAKYKEIKQGMMQVLLTGKVRLV